MANTYYTTIGLEIHAELATKTKMFCACKNDPDETIPNTNICPVCMAHPGSLPVINKEAVRSLIKVGLALKANVADFTEFDRKNYFYPDIPKDYQISQYKYPIVSGGSLNGIAITRVHLEEDTANSKHDRGDFSLVDFNRAGVPLMELVTEPVIHSAEEAGKFARELQLLLRYLGVAEANMEKGEMRVELNLSISPNPEKFGTKVEVKNINSFKAVERAAAFEITRMTELYEAGRENEIVQETRGWNEVKQETFSQRAKEDSHDYRYFPDPDLPKLYLTKAFDFNEIEKELPELPQQKRERYASAYGIKAEDIEMYVIDSEFAEFFESAAKEIQKKDLIQLASNYITSDIVGLRKVNPETKLPEVSAFVKLMQMLGENKLNSRAAKDILVILTNEGGDPENIANEKGLLQKNDEGELKAIVEKVIAANEKVAEEYRAGKENALQFLMGQVMKESKGSANPGVVISLLKQILIVQ